MHASSDGPATVRFHAESKLPTRFGWFKMAVFGYSADAGAEHVILSQGDVRGDGVLLRIHSECMTSEVFGSLKCDCAGQLELALTKIAQEGRGLLIYLRQEGRGIGLINKLRAYALQETGLDTVDANRALDLPDDARRYDAAAAALRHLGVGSVRLMTNNPDKVAGLEELGIVVCSRVRHEVQVQAFSRSYLEAKRHRMRHDLGPAPQSRPATSSNFPG
jgi:GTP cyclohydrolase II